MNIMKRSFIFLLTLLFTLTLSSQTFKKEDIVEVDPSLSDPGKNTWKQATVTGFDSAGKKYMVKLADGNKLAIPSKDPEKWIRPVAKTLALLGPGRPTRYENRDIVLKAFSCRPSELYIKRNVKAQLAGSYKDYTSIYVDFTSFKAQNGYDDTKVKGQHIYPYKIEMLVYLKRTLTFGGKQYTEYQTWEFDRVYEYATRPGKNCEFYPVSPSGAKKISGGWYE
jgi:hypothetical protein